jgi:LysM repeat protein
MRLHFSESPLGRFDRRRSVARTMIVCALGVVALAASACGELEPIVEPEIVDMQLTLDTLRTQVRDAQRNLAEMRAELESRRQELADAQVARAQLEGRVREAERRVSEARQVIEVQREELLAARAERERVFRSSSRFNNQMRPLEKRGGNPVPSASPALNSVSGKRTATAAAMSQHPPVTEIIVKPGDTLYSLARKHRIGLNRLRSINYLTDNQIEVGQILFLSEHRTWTGPSAETNH